MRMRIKVGWGITNVTTRRSWLAVTIRRHETVTGFSRPHWLQKAVQGIWMQLCNEIYVRVWQAKGVTREGHDAMKSWRSCKNAISTATASGWLIMRQTRPSEVNVVQSFFLKLTPMALQWATALVFPWKVLKLHMSHKTNLVQIWDFLLIWDNSRTLLLLSSQPCSSGSGGICWWLWFH